MRNPEFAICIIVRLYEKISAFKIPLSPSCLNKIKHFKKCVFTYLTFS